MDAHAPRGTKSNTMERMGTASALRTQVSGEVTQLVWLGDAGQEMGLGAFSLRPRQQSWLKKKIPRYLNTDRRSLKAAAYCL